MTPAIGATVTGIDLRYPQSSVLLDSLYEKLLTHKVLFFPDQRLTPGQQVAFAETFGEVSPAHPIYPAASEDDRVTVIEYDAERVPDTDTWHTDMTWRADPPFASVLQACEIPHVGGDTIWLSQAAAWQSLPADMKNLLAPLQAVHDMGSFRNDFIQADRDSTALNQAMKDIGSAVHPVVREHPVTGEVHLFVNRGFTTHIAGMQTQDSMRLLAWLFDHMEQPEHQVRLRWSPDMLVIWDNRSTQHYAVNDYSPALRRMHRVTIVNDRRCR